MRRKSSLSPIQQRRDQIEKELERLRSPKNQKSIRDFKAEEGLTVWQERQDEKLRELTEEILMLDSPESYNEMPLAVAAAEIGVTLNELLLIVREGLVEISHHSPFQAGGRITRDELARAIEVGADELVRISSQDICEVFEDGLQHLKSGDIDASERTLERIDGFRSYGSGYWSAYEVGVALIKGELDNVKSSIGYFGGRETDDLATHLPLLRSVVERITPADHPTAVLLESVRAVANGEKKTPFDRTFCTYASSDYFSQMDENQRHAMLLSNVVFEAINKYKFEKHLSRIRGWQSETKTEEFERVVRNAIYTALEAEDTYHDSPSSKLFVDKFVEFFPKRWIPAEHITLLPKKHSKNKPD